MLREVTSTEQEAEYLPRAAGGSSRTLYRWREEGHGGLLGTAAAFVYALAQLGRSRACTVLAFLERTVDEAELDSFEVEEAGDVFRRAYERAVEAGARKQTALATRQPFAKVAALATEEIAHTRTWLAAYRSLVARGIEDPFALEG